jgi:catechol-2,3-dioxygenase
MLSDYPIGAVLLSKDLTASRAFYVDKLGLDIIEETEEAISYASGATTLTVTASTVGTKDEQTQASWKVEDLRAELDTLKQRGVEPEDYDTDEITTVDGIADRGSVWAAYLIDPDGNALGIEQPKE